MAQMFIGLAGAIHIYIFAMESLLWGKPGTNRTFGMTPDMAEHNRNFAFNQGYYNLFLAIAALGGVILSFTHPGAGATALMAYSALSMLGAGLVLIYSQPKLLKAAMIQGLPPLIGLIFLFFGSK
jgi:putative membrane protein